MLLLEVTPDVVSLQQLVSQQKDGNVEERQKLVAEREAQQRRITQLAEETAKLKTELARYSTRELKLTELVPFYSIKD